MNLARNTLGTPCTALPTAGPGCSSGGLLLPGRTFLSAPGYLSPICLINPMAASLLWRIGAGLFPTPIWMFSWKVFGRPGIGGGGIWKCLCGWRVMSGRPSPKLTVTAGDGGETEKLWHDYSPRGNFFIIRFRRRCDWAK